MELYQEALITFRALLDDAVRGGEPEPTAMTLATADPAGRVSARIVLLKGSDERGLVFFTNYESAKASQLDQQRSAALCLLWKSLPDPIQVRVEGAIEKTDPAESDVYFASRPRESQIGAWASLQSQTLPDRAHLETRVEEFERRFANQTVPRPPHWGGYRLVPDMFEFWYGQRARLHERVRYERDGAQWHKRMLYP